MTRLLLFAALVLIAYAVKSQSGTFSKGKVDSLEILASRQATLSDTAKLNVLNELCWQYKNIDTEKALKYGQQAKMLAEEYLNSSITAKEVKRYKTALATSINHIGVVFDYRGEYDKALVFYLKGLNLHEELNDKQRIATSLNNVGIIYYYQGKYLETLKYYNRALQLREELQDERGIAGSLNNIGLVYINQVMKSKDPKGLESAVEHFSRSLKIKEKLGDKQGIARSLGNIGKVYRYKAEFTGNADDYEMAIEYYLKGLKIFDKLGDKKGRSISLADIGDVYYVQKDYKSAEEFTRQAIDVAAEIGAKSELANAYSQLSKIYEPQGKADQALDAYKDYIHIKDSLKNESAAKKMAEMKAALDIQDKERQIEMLSKDNKIQALEAKRQNILRNLLIVVLLLLVVLGVFVYVRYRDNQTGNLELEKLSLVASKTDNYVIITDKNDEIEWVNDAFTRITGFELDEIIGKKPEHILRGENTDKDASSKIEQARREQGAFSGEILNYKKNGEPIWLSFNVNPIIDAPGEVERYINIGNDITEKKKQEEEIEKLSFIAQKTDNFVVLTDKDDCIEWVNEGFTRLFGYELDEIKGIPPGQLLGGKMTDPLTAKRITENKKNKISFREEILNYDKRGNPVWIALSVTPVVNSEGEIERYINIGADISKRKTSEEKYNTVANRLELINSIDNAMMQADSLKEIIDFSIRKLYQDLKFPRISMVLFNFEEGTFYPFSVSTKPGSILTEGTVLPLSDFHGVPHLLKFKNYLVQNLAEKDILSGSDVELMKEGINSYLLCPLVAKNQLLGSLNICSDKIKHFNTELINIIEEIAKGIGISLYQQQLQDKIKESNEKLKIKNDDITYSIKYAKRIQDTIFPSPKAIKAALKNAFVYFKPKDIVSGDFYVLLENDNKVLIGVADCTGHGVPGAFISMIGYNLMNQAVNEYELSKPSEILNHVNKEMYNTLNHDYRETKMRDGMDMGLCAIDFKNRKLEFAGANNSLCVARKGKLLEIKGDQYPVGVFFEGDMKKFTHHDIKLKKGDQIYLFSDGFADQFGGPDEKKYKYSQFKNLILKASECDIGKQEKFFGDAFDEWIGLNGKAKHPIEQTDDLCIIGIEV